jgi:hypothetical protein
MTVAVAACGSDDSGATGATTAGASSTAEAIGDTTQDSTGITDASYGTAPAPGAPVGKIAGVDFAVGSQFVQYESMGAAWRLHLLSGAHTCAEELASLRPAVGVDFPAGNADELPATGPVNVTGVTFIQPDPSPTGPLTTTAGVTLTLDRVQDAPGGHWTGHLLVAPFEDAAGSYAIDVALDAVVCSPTATP